MIVAAGLSPAWQQIFSLGALRVGEVNRAQSSQWCASGKVLNVAIALEQLRADPLAVAPLGGLAGEAAAGDLAAVGVQGHWIRTQGGTRVCTTLLEADNQRTTELVENAGPIAPAELAEFESHYLAALKGAQAVVLTGSIPQGTSPDIFARLLANTAAPAIVDIRGPELKAALACRPLVVKPNREELGHTVGHALDSDQSLLAAMHELNEQGAGWVVVSQGARAVWATSAGKQYRFQPPTIRVVNAIGSGDCLAAGLAWRIAAGSDVLAALPVGIAAASLNATALLPGRLDPAAVLSLAETIAVERL